MDTQATVISLKARANAAQQLDKIASFSEPLSAKQKEIISLLLCSAYTDGMLDALRGVVGQ